MLHFKLEHLLQAVNREYTNTASEQPYLKSVLNSSAFERCRLLLLMLLLLLPLVRLLFHTGFPMSSFTREAVLGDGVFSSVSLSSFVLALCTEL